MSEKPFRILGERFVRARMKKPGSAPGTLVYTGDSLDTAIDLRLLRYSSTKVQEDRNLSIEDVDFSQFSGDSCNEMVNWLHLSGLHDSSLVDAIGTSCNLHPLLQEDILQTDQRPKIEWYQDCLFAAIKVLSWGETGLRSEQLSLVLKGNTVISFSEGSGEYLSEVISRINSGRRIRFMKSDYLFYAIIDAVVDGYFSVLESVGDGLEQLEDKVVDNSSQDCLLQLHSYKREMLKLRKAVWPMREILLGIGREDETRISRDVQVYFRDVYDHSVQIIETVEALRDLQIGLLDLYMTAVSNRMNEVMKILTIIATIFMPLTFIAGIYGMNFEWMPELSVPWAYPVVLLLMLGIGIGLSLYFRFRKWL